MLDCDDNDAGDADGFFTDAGNEMHLILLFMVYSYCTLLEFLVKINVILEFLLPFKQFNS